MSALARIRTDVVGSLLRPPPLKAARLRYDEGAITAGELVSTKVPLLETIDQIRRRIDEASRFVPLERLAISPQCGFASDVVGNLVSEDDQKRKLELVVETARRVWS